MDDARRDWFISVLLGGVDINTMTPRDLKDARTFAMSMGIRPYWNMTKSEQKRATFAVIIREIVAVSAGAI